MRSRFFFLSVSVMAFTFAASAQLTTTVNFNAQPGERDVVDASLTPLPNGNQVEVGYFDSTFDLSNPANAGNLTALESHWHEYGAASITTLAGSPGRFSSSASMSDAQFNGQKIFFWIFKTSNNSAPAVDLSNVQQYGIFSSTGSNWTFPTLGSIFPSDTTTVTSGSGGTTQLAAQDPNQAYWGSIVGSFDTGHLELAAVPEPQQYAIVIGLGLVGFAAWRRSRLVKAA